LAKKRVVNGEDKDIQKLKIEDATYLVQKRVWVINLPMQFRRM
jgi:hypothetical protein